MDVEDNNNFGGYSLKLLVKYLNDKLFDLENVEI